MTILEGTGGFGSAAEIRLLKAKEQASSSSGDDRSFFSYRPILGVSNKRDGFAAPAWSVGSLLYVRNGNTAYTSTARVASIDHNVLTYTGDIGFSTIGQNGEFTVCVPEEPNEGLPFLGSNNLLSGADNRTSGDNNFVSGEDNVIKDGNNTLVSGIGNTACGMSFGVCMGAGNVIGNDDYVCEDSVALGKDNKARYSHDFLIGRGLDAAGADCTALGCYNSPNSAHLLQVGNGTQSARSNALSLDRAGNLAVSGTVTDGNGAIYHIIKLFKGPLGELQFRNHSFGILR